LALEGRLTRDSQLTLTTRSDKRSSERGDVARIHEL